MINAQWLCMIMMFCTNNYHSCAEEDLNAQDFSPIVKGPWPVLHKAKQDPVQSLLLYL